MITRNTVASQLRDYLQHRTTRSALVDWAERAIMDEEFDERDLDTTRDITSRLGLAGVREFGLTWKTAKAFCRDSDILCRCCSGWKRVVVGMTSNEERIASLAPSMSVSKRIPTVIAFSWAIIAGLVVPGETQQRSCTFPGVKVHCEAPRGSAAVEWLEPNGDQLHKLLLRVRSGVKPVLIHEFGRSVDVLWSPDGRALAITDHAGSSDSTVWVVKIDAPDHAADVESAFEATFGDVPEIYRNGHRYFQATSWRSPSALEFAIKAYDAAPNGEYNAQFLYRLDGRVQRR